MTKQIVVCDKITRMPSIRIDLGSVKSSNLDSIMVTKQK